MLSPNMMPSYVPLRKKSPELASPTQWKNASSERKRSPLTSCSQLGTSVALGVGVVSVTRRDLVEEAARTESTAAAAYEAKKVKDYERGCFVLPPGYFYLPVVVESGGRWALNAQAVLKRIAGLCAVRWRRIMGTHFGDSPLHVPLRCRSGWEE